MDIQCRSADQEEVDEAFFKQSEEVSYSHALVLMEEFQPPFWEVDTARFKYQCV